MQFPTLLTTAFAVTLAAALPTLETRQQSNCTEYTSPSAGSVCLDRPYDCTATYMVQPGDNCGVIANNFGNFTLSILYYWNPDITRSCLFLRAYTPVCINTPWYTYVAPIQQPVGTIVETANLGATEQPVPVIYGTSGSCAKYQLAGEGVYMYNMVADNNITNEQFLEWNPNVNGTDPMIQAGYWYAVGC